VDDLRGLAQDRATFFCESAIETPAMLRCTTIVAPAPPARTAAASKASGSLRLTAAILDGPASPHRDDAKRTAVVERTGMLIILAVVLLLVLSSPWNLIAFLVIVPLWVLELFGWNRTVKHRRKAVGAETLIGREAVVSTDCRPSGQVRLDGEIWEAHCDLGAAAGDKVRVVARDGLVLVVRPA
jgi:membrane protein implicated in regulation of membrane protease activity